MTTREEATRLADALLEAVVLDKHMMQAAALLRQWPDAAAQEPVAWREHVEQRIRTWRQSTMNRSGDRLAIDDFMGQDSIDDLVDFVCDVYAAPPAAQPAKLWLWRNFVDGRPEYWAFDNPFPVHMDGGDPQTLGEPCGYAIFKPSRPGRTDVSEAEVLRRIRAAKEFKS